MLVSMLSTIDNPFDPFDEFDSWYNYDVVHGYNSCSYLAKIAKTSDELPENLVQIEIERAIDEILEFNVNGMFCKITKEIENESWNDCKYDKYDTPYRSSYLTL